jgi:hypothetical protein
MASIARRGLPLILLLLAAIAAGCPAPPSAATDSSGQSQSKVTVAVTQDFGHELILAEEAEIEDGTDAMTALQSVAGVETKYGGGFVQSIEGLSSEYQGGSQKRDWLYYINGISLSLGARDYALRDGDIEQWDFRDWSYQPMVPAIIGAFPQPFLSGVRGEPNPTAVVYEASFAGEAEALAAKLEEWGATRVALTNAEALSDGAKEQNNLIILAGADNGLILELNELHKKLGFFAYFEGGTITVLNGKGEPADEYGAGWGLIQATQNPWSPGGVGSGEGCVFIVTGADESGIKSAANTLIANGDGLRYAYAVLVNNSDIIKIP